MSRVNYAVCCLVAGLIGSSGAVSWGEEISIQAAPGSVNLNTAGQWVTIHADIRYSLVISASVTVNGIPVSWTKSDAQGDLVAKFDIDTVRKIIAPPSAELRLLGEYRDPTGVPVPFEGTTSIQVISKGGSR